MARTNGSDNAITIPPSSSPSPSPLQQKQQPIQNHNNDSCSSCLWTGVITCLGLSAYFAHIAFDDETSIVGTKTATTNMTTTTSPVVTNSTLFKNHTNNYNTGSSHAMRIWFQQQYQKLYLSSLPLPNVSTRYNKPVFLCISAGWFVVGLYRWHLG